MTAAEQSRIAAAAAAAAGTAGRKLERERAIYYLTERLRACGYSTGSRALGARPPPDRIAGILCGTGTVALQHEILAEEAISLEGATEMVEYRRFAPLAALGAATLVVLMAGCGKKDADVTEGPGPVPPPVAETPSKPVAPAAPAAPKALSGDAWADMASARKAVKSYTMVMDVGGVATMQSMKLADGVPVAMKMDMGDRGWVLTQFDKKVQYVFNPQTKVAMKTPLPQDTNIKGEMDKQIGKFKKEGVKVTNDTVDGLACWKVATAEGAAWMDKNYGLPRQMESGGKVTKLKYEAINAVPDSVFQLPAGTKVQDMADVMKQMPKNLPKGVPAIPGR